MMSSIVVGFLLMAAFFFAMPLVWFIQETIAPMAKDLLIFLAELPGKRQQSLELARKAKAEREEAEQRALNAQLDWTKK